MEKSPEALKRKPILTETDDKTYRHWDRWWDKIFTKTDFVEMYKIYRHSRYSSKSAVFAKVFIKSWETSLEILFLRKWF